MAIPVPPWPKRERGTHQNTVAWLTVQLALLTCGKFESNQKCGSGGNAEKPLASRFVQLLIWSQHTSFWSGLMCWQRLAWMKCDMQERHERNIMSSNIIDMLSHRKLSPFQFNTSFNNEKRFSRFSIYFQRYVSAANSRSKLLVNFKMSLFRHKTVCYGLKEEVKLGAAFLVFSISSVASGPFRPPQQSSGLETRILCVMWHGHAVCSSLVWYLNRNAEYSRKLGDQD